MLIHMNTRYIWLRDLYNLPLLTVIWLVLSLGDAHSQMAEVTCGQVLTTDTIMGHDLNNCPGDGFILGASHIRLDCASHALTGSGTGTGIRIPSGVGGVEMVNCHVTGFGTGIDIAGGGTSPNLIANNVFNNAMNVQVPNGGLNLWDYSAGLVIAFRSSATNLVPDDLNGQHDIFIRDRFRAITSQASVAANGEPGDGRSTTPVLSADGRIVVFSSRATNLVLDDTNEAEDIFIHDRRLGDVTRLSLSSDGTQANGNSFAPALSADGLVVAFESVATNLVAGDTNAHGDIYVLERQGGEVARISLALNGAEADGRSVASVLSADGLVVAYESVATNLVAGDANDLKDVFVYDRLRGVTSRVSVASNGTEANGVSRNATLSAVGDIVAFESAATNLVGGDTNRKSDIFVHNRESGITSRVTIAANGAEADGSSSHPVLSAAGRFIAFRSSATNLVPGDTNDKADIFVHDHETGMTTRVSLDSNGIQVTGNSEGPLGMTSDGRMIAFQSFAVDLVLNDTMGVRDTFVHDRLTGITTRVSIGVDGSEADRASFNLAMSGSMPETNIVGGPFIGGNVYMKPDGTGFSDMCRDDNRDGFCDTSHMISEGDVDVFPLKTVAP